MLKEIRIRDFATIEELVVTFSDGLTVLSGETGAGKSIILGALALALGAPTSPDMVRTGGDKLQVEVLFQGVPSLPGIETWTLEDGELVLGREVSKTGRSKAFMGGKRVKASLQKEIGNHLVDILGQHNQHALLDSDNHITFLDSLGGLSLLTEMVAHLFEENRELFKRKQKLTSDLQNIETELELAEYRSREISEIAPLPGELQKLKEKRIVLENAHDIVQTIHRVNEELYGSEDSITGRLWERSHHLRALSPGDHELLGLVDEWDNLLFGLEELARALREKGDRISLNPEELLTLNQRIEDLSAIERRFGSIEAALEFGDKTTCLQTDLSRIKDDLGKIKTEKEAVKQKLSEEGVKLSGLRETAALKLSAFMNKELKDLGMEKAIFICQLTPQGSLPPSMPLEPTGYETVEFLFSANPGEVPKALNRVASGGELSRIMLALKNRAAGVDKTPTLVFDEVDSGIGGMTAEVVGRKLKKLSRYHQILCVTHLPQIAAMGKEHFRVVKITQGERTNTSIQHLPHQGRIEELARMLGGEFAHETAREHAKVLLDKGIIDV